MLVQFQFYSLGASGELTRSEACGSQKGEGHLKLGPLGDLEVFSMLVCFELGTRAVDMNYIP